MPITLSMHVHTLRVVRELVVNIPFLCFYVQLSNIIFSFRYFSSVFLVNLLANRWWAIMCYPSSLNCICVLFNEWKWHEITSFFLSLITIFTKSNHPITKVVSNNTTNCYRISNGVKWSIYSNPSYQSRYVLFRRMNGARKKKIFKSHAFSFINHQERSMTEIFKTLGIPKAPRGS